MYNAIFPNRDDERKCGMTPVCLSLYRNFNYVNYIISQIQYPSFMIEFYTFIKYQVNFEMYR